MTSSKHDSNSETPMTAACYLDDKQNLREEDDIEIFDENQPDERVIAEVATSSNSRIIFTYEDETGEYGMEELTEEEWSSYLLAESFRTILEAYMFLTDESIPIPDVLVEECRDYDLLYERVRRRETTKDWLEIKKTSNQFLALSAAMSNSLAGHSCFKPYYHWWDWRDNAQSGLGPAEFYSSQVVGGKCHYVESYIFNCTPSGASSDLWARQRFYYKQNNKYRKNND